MAAIVRTNSTDISPDINTTPLIDVMLVLLTLLIMTLPMQTHAIKVDTGQGEPIAPPEIVQLSVDWDGTARWNGVAVDHATLKSYLADAARRSPQPDIVVSADKLTKYDMVAGILADAAQAGETHIGFDETYWH